MSGVPATSPTKMTDRAPVNPWVAGVLGRCPVCGHGHLFDTLLGLCSTCSHCQADLRAADPGDGPAVFAIFILGPIFAGAALFFEMTVRPAFWVHLLLWPPLLLVGSVWLLRVIKGILVALQFANDAGEGRLE